MRKGCRFIGLLIALAVMVVVGTVWGGDQALPQGVVVTLVVAIPFVLAAVVTMLLVRRNT
jgi:quinol-cytochrome oxidoreductase complex cytochrome b subunit